MNDEIRNREDTLVKITSAEELVMFLCECGVAGPEIYWGPKPDQHAGFCPGGQMAFWISRHPAEAVSFAQSFAAEQPSPRLEEF